MSGCCFFFKRINLTGMCSPNVDREIHMAYRSFENMPASFDSTMIEYVSSDLSHLPGYSVWLLSVMNPIVPSAFLSSTHTGGTSGYLLKVYSVNLFSF